MLISTIERPVFSGVLIKNGKFYNFAAIDKRGINFYTSILRNIDSFYIDAMMSNIEPPLYDSPKVPRMISDLNIKVSFNWLINTSRQMALDLNNQSCLRTFKVSDTELHLNKVSRVDVGEVKYFCRNHFDIISGQPFIYGTGRNDYFSVSSFKDFEEVGILQQNMPDTITRLLVSFLYVKALSRDIDVYNGLENNKVAWSTDDSRASARKKTFSISSGSDKKTINLSNRTFMEQKENTTINGNEGLYKKWKSINDTEVVLELERYNLRDIDSTRSFMQLIKSEFAKIHPGRDPKFSVNMNLLRDAIKGRDEIITLTLY